MRFIFDTNLLVSAIIKPVSIPGLALERAMHLGKLYFSDETSAEIRDVLVRDKFDRFIPKNERLAKLDVLFRDIMLISETVEPIIACRDPKDDKFLSLAISIRSACIVSGDQDLLVLHTFRGIPIVNAADFMSMTF